MHPPGNKRSEIETPGLTLTSLAGLETVPDTAEEAGLSPFEHQHKSKLRGGKILSIVQKVSWRLSRLRQRNGTEGVKPARSASQEAKHRGIIWHRTGWGWKDKPGCPGTAQSQKTPAVLVRAKPPLSPADSWTELQGPAPALGPRLWGGPSACRWWEACPVPSSPVSGCEVSSPCPNRTVCGCLSPQPLEIDAHHGALCVVQLLAARSSRNLPSAAR